jgi:hypothetical protein
MKNKILKSFVYITFAAISILSINCATIVHGTKQQVPISSNPTGAQVTVDGQIYYTTPCLIELERNKAHIVTFTLDGYQTEHIKLESGLSTWFYVGIIPGLVLIGPVYDLISGGAYTLEPELVFATLKKPKK